MNELQNYAKDERPWGEFERYTLNEPTTVKLITVKPGEAFSLQTHEGRSEFWRVVAGSGEIVTGDTTHEAHAGGHFYIERGAKHRASAGPEGLTILEISFGDFDENDIKRLEDKYGRA